MPKYCEFDDELVEEVTLTDAEIDRQDEVDNAIYEMVKGLMKHPDTLKWDVEIMGMIRDVVEDVIVDVLKDQTEMEFYPYIEMEECDG